MIEEQKIVTNIFKKIEKIDSNCNVIEHDNCHYFIADWNNKKLQKIENMIFNLYKMGFKFETDFDESWISCECGKYVPYDHNYKYGDTDGIFGDGFFLCEECCINDYNDVADILKNQYDQYLETSEVKDILIKEENWQELNENEFHEKFDEFLKFENYYNEQQKIINFLDNKNYDVVFYSGYDAKKECYQNFTILTKEAE